MKTTSSTSNFHLDKVSIPEIVGIAERGKMVMSTIKDFVMEPHGVKMPPVFSMTQVAELCGLDRAQFAYWIKKDEAQLPTGKLNSNGSRREFTVAEVRQWAQQIRPQYPRDLTDRSAITLTTSIFKGGATKTTTTINLAQALSLRGYRVLMIDADPQGSLTTLCGLSPDVDIPIEKTLLPVLSQDEESVQSAIQSTYWDGIDLIAASTSLSAAEFTLPTRQMQEADFQFWACLDKGLDAVRDHYDIIIIDTPPSLGYVTINAIYAANCLIVPIPTSPLDFASSCQFWDLFSDLAGNLLRLQGAEKQFDAVHILRTKTKNDATYAQVAKWIASCYGDLVCPIEIPETVVAGSNATEFKSIYDISKYDGSHKTFKRARTAYDSFADYIEQSLIQIWVDRMQ